MKFTKNIILIKIFFFVFLTLSFLFNFNLNASDNRFELKTDYNQEAKNITPKFNWIWYYNENWFSTLESYYSNLTTTDTIEGFSESNLATIYQEKDIKSNLISGRLDFDSIKPFLGVTLEYKDIDRKEFGYFHLPASLGDYWVSFENKVNIKALMPFIRLGMDYDGQFMKSYTNIDIMPSYQLNVSQNTQFKPIVNELGTLSSKKRQEMGFTIEQEFYFKTSSIIDIFIQGLFSRWATKYNVKTLNYVNNNFVFENSEVDTLFTYGTLSLNLVLVNLDFLAGLKPFFGIGYNWDNVKDRINNQEEKQISVQFNFGLKFRTDYINHNDS